MYCHTQTKQAKYTIHNLIEQRYSEPVLNIMFYNIVQKKKKILKQKAEKYVGEIILSVKLY